ncbi:MAG: molybdate ABC transporter substrate-binding protein [Betaproteobacteria bacterium]|nr:molybdate ABC transporter substrate-binding protein [Betaproteobacteria bacterium]
MSERRRILKALMAAGLWTAVAPFDVAWAQKKAGKKKPAASEKKLDEQPIIAASSDLLPLLEDIVRGFEGGGRVRIIVSAADRLYSQIQSGEASFEMFLSADETLVTQLIEADKTEGEGDVYAIGRLAFYVPAKSPLKADNYLSDVRTALRDGRLQLFTIANPDTDPYGRLAEDVLRQKLVWDEIQPLLAIGEDVSQTAQMAASGVGQAALVAYSQSGQLMSARGGKCVLVSDSLCQSLSERMVLLKNASATTRRFYRYMLSDRVKGTLRRYGFLAPD